MCLLKLSRIVDVYGENVFEITDDFVRVTIPFAYERYFGTQVVEQKTEQKTEQKNLTQLVFYYCLKYNCFDKWSDICDL